MKVIHQLTLLAGLALLITACNRADSFEIPAGTEVTVQKQDGVEIRGTLVEVRPDQVVLDAGGVRTQVPRSEIRVISAVTAPGGPARSTGDPGGTTGTRAGSDRDANRQRESDGEDDERGNPVARMLDRRPEYREVTIPSGTLLPAALQSAVASDTSDTEDNVRAILRRPFVIDGTQVLPAGTTLHGNVITAERPGRVTGRGSVSFRFTRIDTPEDGRMQMATAPITRVARATKKKDAAKIGVGAAGGAIVGGLLGGGDGAAKGAAAGGAAGTGVVLSTRGEEVRLPTGTPVSVRLTAPLRVRVPVAR
ncbi:MAG: hypothetical protein H0T05_02950 [Acidobacteria bacterium]|nr:hypothetical protein [Acidobacteriota bacterium]MBA3888440.1 hypothetical protein [Acidobacteriota bacterium]